MEGFTPFFEEGTRDGHGGENFRIGAADRQRAACRSGCVMGRIANFTTKADRSYFGQRSRAAHEAICLSRTVRFPYGGTRMQHFREKNATWQIISKLVYLSVLKLVEFIGDSLDCLRTFPVDARRTAGFQLDRVQRDLDPTDWKPMASIGAGVREIRIREDSGAFRVLYVAKFEDAIFVLHCFQKKSQATSKRDVEIATSRYRQLKEKQG
jgi:phage-related protein